MKREIIAGGLLLFLIAGSLLNIRRVEVLTETVAACALRSERHAARGDFEAALKALDQGLEIWDKAHGYTNVFIRHPELDAAYEAFYDIRAVLLQKDEEAVPGAYAKLLYRLDCMAFMERLSAGSVF